MEVFKRILHPTDFSTASRPALKLALQLAQQNSAELVLLYVLSPVVPFMGDVYVAPSAYEQLSSAARNAATRKLGALVVRAHQAGARARHILAEGAPAEEIVRCSVARKAGLIVMGTHGRTGFTRLVAGSVAASVMQQARCPVLTVRVPGRVQGRIHEV